MKLEADIKFAESNLEDATRLYEQCLETDPGNEYVYANLGLIYMMKQDYQRCIDYSSQALDIIDGFFNDTKSFSNENRLEVKILMRRGKSYESVGDNERAKVDLDKALLMEPQNGEAKTLAKRVQDKLDALALETYNKQAVEY
jgi:tetratricopeptide (TPR) repeat protein